MAERTARLRQAVTASGADIESDPVLESIGTVDLLSRHVAVQSQLGAETAVRLASLGSAQRAGEAVGDAEPMESVFIGDEVFELGAGGRWVRFEVEWWRRPLWSLDALKAAGSEWTTGDVSEVHGMRTMSMAGSISRAQLKQIDPFWHKLLGRRAKDDLPTRVWLDDAGRAIRIAWTLPPSQMRPGDQHSWTITEFWDWGLPVTIEAPPA